MISNRDTIELEIMLHNGFMQWQESLRQRPDFEDVSKLSGGDLMNCYLSEIKQLWSKK